MTMETVVEAQQRLEGAGFVRQLVTDGGRLRSTATGETFDPAGLMVADIARFEGEPDPGDEAIMLAITTCDGEPVGTITTAYGPNASAGEAEVLGHLHRMLVSDEEAAAHDEHDHVAAVFPDRRSAEAAIDDLREVGLGSDHLGAAIHHQDRVVFEHDESLDFAHDVEAGTGTGAVIGLLGGMLVFVSRCPESAPWEPAESWPSGPRPVSVGPCSVATPGLGPPARTSLHTNDSATPRYSRAKSLSPPAATTTRIWSKTPYGATAADSSRPQIHRQ